MQKALKRRTILLAGAVGMIPRMATADEDLALLGKPVTESSLVRLAIPPVFANGFSVPVTLAVDSPMTESDHVRSVLIVAPHNPIVTVAKFQFTAQSGLAAVSTRIRLAQPQTVYAVAEMSDGSLLMAKTSVKVETDGCS